MPPARHQQRRHTGTRRKRRINNLSELSLIVDPFAIAELLPEAVASDAAIRAAEGAAEASSASKTAYVEVDTERAARIQRAVNDALAGHRITETDQLIIDTRDTVHDIVGDIPGVSAGVSAGVVGAAVVAVTIAVISVSYAGISLDKLGVVNSAYQIPASHSEDYREGAPSS